jgi:hypothetical protein
MNGFYFQVRELSHGVKLTKQDDLRFKIEDLRLESDIEIIAID